ncbi:MAG: hypothetical protein ABL864_13090 [Terricaulis sp.]|jgi:hypothetical protein
MQKIQMGAIATIMAACSPPVSEVPPRVPWAPIALDHTPEYWVERQADVASATMPTFFIDAATINDAENIRRVAVTAFMAVHPGTPWATARMNYVTEFDCAGRLVRPISTTMTSRGGPALTNHEDTTWRPLEQAENMQRMFDFVCSSPDQRAGNTDFAQYADVLPIEDMADVAIARESGDPGG